MSTSSRPSTTAAPRAPSWVQTVRRLHGADSRSHRDLARSVATTALGAVILLSLIVMLIVR